VTPESFGTLCLYQENFFDSHRDNRTMPLHWTDTNAIALALHTAYPDQDRLVVTLDDISALVRGLPAFADGGPSPDPRRLEHILWTWMRVADGGMCDKIPDTLSGAGG
jgi:FeS assembly protein IscX